MQPRLGRALWALAAEPPPRHTAAAPRCRRATAPDGPTHDAGHDWVPAVAWRKGKGPSGRSGRAQGPPSPGTRLLWCVSLIWGRSCDGGGAWGPPGASWRQSSCEHCQTHSRRGGRLAKGRWQGWTRCWWAGARAHKAEATICQVAWAGRRPGPPPGPHKCRAGLAGAILRSAVPLRSGAPFVAEQEDYPIRRLRVPCSLSQHLGECDHAGCKPRAHPSPSSASRHLAALRPWGRRPLA